MLPFPMIWYWNSTTRSLVSLGSTEASKRDRERDREGYLTSGQNIIFMKFSKKKKDYWYTGDYVTSDSLI